MRELFLHIGTHKTGSTAIQQALWRHRDHLRKRHGLAIFSNPPNRRRLKVAHTVDAQLTAELRLHIQRCIASARLQPTDAAVLSWEGFSGNPYTGYANADALAAMTRAATQPYPVRIIVYLRQQDDFVESLYTQSIHQGRYWSFGEFVAGLPDEAFRWDRLLDRFAAHFGREAIRVQPYHRSRLPRAESLWESFLAQLAITDRALMGHGERTRYNAGYSRGALELALLANGGLDEAQRSQLRQILQRVSAKAPFESYSLWQVQERAAFLARFAESNAKVAREWLGEHDGPLFPATESARHDGEAPPTSLATVLPEVLSTLLTQSDAARHGRLVRVARRIEALGQRVLGRT